MKRPHLLQGDRAVCVVLALLTLVVYCRVAGFDFVSMDDYIYVAENPQVRAGLTSESIAWAFTSTRAANWHPLTWLSLMADTDLSGYSSQAQDGPAGPPGAHTYHTTNLFLHIVNVLLLYWLFVRITGRRWPSAFVAAAFAVHPLHVESIAWISERKDVLSTAFWLGTMLAYTHYVQQRTWRRYALVIALFALGLMAKPMLVTLPIVLLLMDWWPLGRYGKRGIAPSPPAPLPQGEGSQSPSPPPSPARGEGEGRPHPNPLLGGEGEGNLTPGPSPERRGGFGISTFLEKIPLFALAAASCVVTFWAQRAGGAVQSLQLRPLGERIANSVVACAAYLLKTVYPAGLAAYYPHPGTSLPVWQVIISAVVLAGITMLAIGARRRHPYLLVGWLWYVVTLIPVIGLVQVGDQAMADRYTYVPLIGIFFALAWTLPELFPRGERALAAASGAVILALAVCAIVQIGYWRNGVTLFERTVAVTSRPNPVALFDLGVAYEKQAHDDERAARCYRAAVRAEPRFMDAHCNLGGVLVKLDRLREARRAYQAALKLNPNNALAHGGMGYLLAKQGRIDEAISEYRTAARLAPNNADIQYNLGALEALKHRLQP